MRADDEPTIEGPGRARERRSGARFLPGTMLDGRYRIVAPLGHGGMGEAEYLTTDLGAWYSGVTVAALLSLAALLLWGVVAATRRTATGGPAAGRT